MKLIIIFILIGAGVLYLLVNTIDSHIINLLLALLIGKVMQELYNHLASSKKQENTNQQKENTTAQNSSQNSIKSEKVEIQKIKNIDEEKIEDAQNTSNSSNLIKEIHTFSIKNENDQIGYVTFSYDGKYVLFKTSYTISLWDVHNFNNILTIDEGENLILPVALSPDGKTIAYSAGWNGKITLRDIHTANKNMVIDGYTDPIDSLAFSPDGNCLVSAGSSMGKEDYYYTVKIWDTATGREIHAFKKNNEAITSVAFTLDGQKIFVSRDFGNYLWSAKTYKKILTFENEKDVHSVSFSPDGKIIIVSNRNEKAIMLWDVKTGKEIRTFDGHKKGVNAVAFSPNGKYFISGSNDKTLKIWDIQTGDAIFTINGHNESITSVAFSPDGKYILSGSTSMVKLWEFGLYEEQIVVQEIIEEKEIIQISQGISSDNVEIQQRLSKTELEKKELEKKHLQKEEENKQLFEEMQKLKEELEKTKAQSLQKEQELQQKIQEETKKSKNETKPKEIDKSKLVVRESFDDF